MKTVILAEKPDQGKKFANALGKSTYKRDHCLVKSDIIPREVIVTWGIGHLVSLAEPEMYDKRYKKWDIKSLPILPEKMKYEITKRTKTQFNAVKKQLTQADEIIIATDPDREGENIAYSILMMCGKTVYNKPKKRLWVNSLEKADVRKAFLKLKDSKETFNYYKEAQTRQISDWLIGMNYTRYFTLLAQKAGLKGVFSIGRVQTPTNTLICKNYSAIKNFKPVPYWLLKGIHETDIGKIEFTENKKESKYWSKDELNQIESKHKLNTVKGAIVQSVKIEMKSKKSPKLFDLGNLQSYCSNQFGWTAKKTSDIMQKLYDSGYLSYPRTDSNLITTSEFSYLKSNLLKYKEVLNVDFKAEHLEPRKEYVNNDKVLEHYAIIPTTSIPSLKKIKEDENKLYRAVVTRTLLMFAPDYEYESTTVLVDAHGLTFKTIGNVPKIMGWKSLEKIKTKRIDHDKERRLPKYEEGQYIPFNIKKESKETKPPKQLTEAELVKKTGVLAKYNLGTPATRSGIIETLKRRGYIENDGKTKLKPTEKGLLLYDKTKDGLIGKPEMTAKWEEYLEKIGKGNGHQKVFIDKTRESIPKQFEQWDSIGFNSQEISNVQNSNVEKIGKYTVVKKAKLWEVTAEGETDHFPIWLNIAGKKLSETVIKQLLINGQSKSKIKGFKSKKGKKFSTYLVLKDKKVAFDFDRK